MKERTPFLGLAERAAQKIRQEIRTRKLKPGEVIATEIELATDLGVSRNAIREAVGRLRGLGLVESRQCKGIVVAQANPTELMRLVIPHYVIDQATFADLAEMRYCLEIGAVDLALDYQTKADIARLIRLGEQFAEAACANSEKVDEIDVEFHRTILAATRSKLLGGMHHVVTAFFLRAKAEIPHWNVGLAPTAEEHLTMAQAFAARDRDLARQLLSKHLSKYLKIRTADWSVPEEAPSA